MNKAELIKALSDYEDDQIVTFKGVEINTVNDAVVEDDSMPIGSYTVITLEG